MLFTESETTMSQEENDIALWKSLMKRLAWEDKINFTQLPRLLAQLVMVSPQFTCHSRHASQCSLPAKTLASGKPPAVRNQIFALTATYDANEAEADRQALRLHSPFSSFSTCFTSDFLWVLRCIRFCMIEHLTCFGCAASAVSICRAKSSLVCS